VSTKLGSLLVVGVVAMIVSAGAGGGPEATFKFTAALKAGQEVPHPKGVAANSSGRFTATVSGTNMTWRLSFSHLSGPATAAHVHMGARGISGPVLIPLCGPCTSPAGQPMTTITANGKAKLTQTEIKAMEAGKTYANVHTTKNPNGEIRGQITRVM
jgi:hypothetical protein